MKILEAHRGKRDDESDYLSYTHRRCAECGEAKPVAEFYRKKTRTKRGWAWDVYCIECRRAYCRQYGAENKPKRNARLRKWRRENIVAARAKDRRARLKRNYGLTEQDVERMRAAQGGHCAICPCRGPLVIDHCHNTGRVRGLLCQTCNTRLGWYEMRVDMILSLQRYLVAAHADVLLEIANG